MSPGGGIVRRVIPAPRDRAAVEGIWTGGSWSPGEPMSLGLHRNGKLLRTLTLKGIDQPQGRRVPLLIIARSDSHGIQEGDVLTFGDALASEFAVQELPPELLIPTVASLAPHSLPTTIDRREFGYRAVVFHAADAALALPTSFVQTLAVSGREFKVRMRPLQAIPVATEIKLNGGSVSLTRLVSTVNPLRSFTLGAGQEMLLGNRGRGRFKKTTIDTFEPRVSVASGSVRIIFDEPQPTVIPLFVRPVQPYQLLAAVAMAVSSGDQARLFEELEWHHVYSNNRLLGYIRALAAQGAEVGTSLGTSVVLGPKDVDWLEAILRLPLRRDARVGELFAVDFHREWCRVMSKGDAANTEEHWTLYFTTEWSEKIKSLLNHQVSVTFETRAPLGIRQGTGVLLHVAPYTSTAPKPGS